MSGAHGQRNNGGLIPMATLRSRFGRMMPDALAKLKDEAAKRAQQGNALDREAEPPMQLAPAAVRLTPLAAAQHRA